MVTEARNSQSYLQAGRTKKATVRYNSVESKSLENQGLVGSESGEPRVLVVQGQEKMNRK